MHGHPGSTFPVVVCGASSLRGKEIKQVLDERRFPSSGIVLVDEAVAAGTLTQAGGEATFIQAVEEESFHGARFAFFAGEPEVTSRYWSLAQRAGATVIDLTGGLPETAHARVWIPALASALPVPSDAAPDVDRVIFSPPTACVIACSLAVGLKTFSPARLVIVFFPPVSERGQAGVDELESQAAGLLSFQEISQTVFGAQVAFNLLSDYGEGSRRRLGEIRSTIARQAAAYLGGRVPLPAIQLVQAPVFYGYAFAAYVEFGALPEFGRLEEALVSVGMRVQEAGETPPNNASVAGENEIHLARIERDASVSRGVWLWGVADNLRLAATNAVRIAEELLVA